MAATELVSTLWSYHPQRDALLAEAHIRPFTPLSAPTLVTRIAVLSGEGGAAADREHMTALCRRLGEAEPGPDSRSCVLDAGAWRLRWERHTEFSTWTFFRAPTTAALFTETALDLAPGDWLAALPGPVLVAARMEVRAAEGERVQAVFGLETVASGAADAGCVVETDFRPDALGMTRFLLLESVSDPGVTGRLAQSLLEIETYRLMALLAFPVAGQSSAAMRDIEAKASELAEQLAQRADPDADRELLGRLAALAGETEALIGRTGFRFDAAAAYYEIVGDRIERLREVRIDGLQTIGEFMQRRLDPAMRTCATAAARQRAAIARIARMTQILSTRVEVAVGANSSALLASMDRRAGLQVRLQQTVETLSAAAIAYYLVGLLSYALGAAAKVRPGFDPALAAGLLAPLILLAVWLRLRAWRRKLSSEIEAPERGRLT